MENSRKIASADWPADAWQLGMMGIELWTMTATTVMLRNWSLAARWSDSSRHPNTENSRRLDEKITAAMEVNAELWRVAFGMWSSAFNRAGIRVR